MSHDEIPHYEVRYRASLARLETAFQAGALTREQARERLRRVKATRDEAEERDRVILARWAYHDLSPHQKRVKHLNVRATRKRVTV